MENNWNKFKLRSTTITKTINKWKLNRIKKNNENDKSTQFLKLKLKIILIDIIIIAYK